VLAVCGHDCGDGEPLLISGQGQDAVRPWLSAVKRWVAVAWVWRCPEPAAIW